MNKEREYIVSETKHFGILKRIKARSPYHAVTIYLNSSLPWLPDHLVYVTRGSSNNVQAFDFKPAKTKFESYKPVRTKGEDFKQTAHIPLYY